MIDKAARALNAHSAGLAQAKINATSCGLEPSDIQDTGARPTGHDTDVNLTNVLMGHDWKIWRIDFTRAFRLNKEPQHVDDLVRCDRQLFDKLKTLDENELAMRRKGYLKKDGVKAVMSLRDKIVAYFQKPVSERGETEVLY